MKTTTAERYEIIKGKLVLFDADGKKIAKNAKYGGSLDLNGCTSLTALPEGLTVGGSLYLNGCTSLTALPEGLTVGGSLDLRGTSLTALPEGLTVGGSLDLNGCTSLTALPEGLTVGSYLYLNGCTSLTALPEGLTVGGYLYLNGCTSLTAPKNLNKNVSGLSLKISVKVEASFNFKGFSIADGILGRILSKKSGVMKIRKVASKEILYVVSDGKGNNAHGKTVKEAMFDLRFKTADRDISAYRGMKLTTVKTTEDWAIAYHVVTGSCNEGIKDFIRKQGEVKNKYTLKEIIAMTKNAYRGDVFARAVS